MVADCPKMQQDSETGVGLCFKCGSTEHSAFQCRAKTVEGKGITTYINLKLSKCNATSGDSDKSNIHGI